MQSPEVVQIKERLNIVEVVGGYVKLQKAGRNWRACCPFHKERTPSFNVSPERGSYMCFGCGEKGDVFSFVQKMDGVEFGAALKQLAERAGVELPKRGHGSYIAPTPEQTEKVDRLREVCDAATAFFEEQFLANDAVKKYVAERGVTDETRGRWRIGYAPAEWRTLSEHLVARGFSQDDMVDAGLSLFPQKKEVEAGSNDTPHPNPLPVRGEGANPTRSGRCYDRFRGRIMFPLFDASGRTIAFSGRFFEKTEGGHEEGEPAKYVNSPETELFKKSRVLYGFDKAKEAVRKHDCVMLVEGQFDVVLSHQAGLPFVVAVSGTALTEEHLGLLGRFTKRVIMALDNDAAGLKAGLRGTLMALGLGFDVKIPMIEGGKDPADLVRQDPEILRAAVRNATTAIEFFLHALRPMAKDERGYKRLAETHVVPLIAAVKSKIDQAHFVRITAEALNVPEDAVRAEVAKVAASTARIPGAAPTVETPQVISASPMSAEPLPLLDKKVAMLLARFGAESDTGIRVVEIIGIERVADIQSRTASLTDRLLFEFEGLGDADEESAANILADLERSTIAERIVVVRRDLRAAELARNTEESARLTALITKLTREQHHYAEAKPLSASMPDFLKKR